MEYQKALEIAFGVFVQLELYCEKIDVAGSIRRMNPEVKDIEICAIPKPYEIGLFESGFATIVNQWEKVKGELEYGKCKYTQRVLPQGIKLDLFMPHDFDYYRQLAIRTGSADYSHQVIANGWLKLGWCGSDKGLRKQSDCIRVKDKWKCENADCELPPVWKDERGFFNWINVPYIEPQYRNIVMDNEKQIPI